MMTQTPRAMRKRFRGNLEGTTKGKCPKEGGPATAWGFVELTRSPAKRPWVWLKARTP